MKTEEQNTEQKILKAAERLFMEQGFMKTTTAQIAREAGCNQALVHYYYRTKEHLFEQVYGEKVEMMAEMFLVNAASGSFEDKIRAMIDSHLTFLQENPGLLPFIIRESLNGSGNAINLLLDKVRECMGPVAARLEKDLADEVAKGNIRPITLFDLVLNIGAMDAAPILISPLLKKALGLSDEELKQRLERRKQEVADTILSRLRKQ